MKLSLVGTEQVTVSLGSRSQRHGNAELLMPYLRPVDRIKAKLGKLAMRLPESFSTVSLPAEVLPDVRQDAYGRLGQLMELIIVGDERRVHQDLGAVTIKTGRHRYEDLVAMNSAVIDLDRFMAFNLPYRPIVE